MKFFVNLRKRMLRRKVYRYALKVTDLQLKSNCYRELANRYLEKNNHNRKMFGNYEDKYLRKEQECKFKSDHYERLSKIYEDKKIDAEMELNNLNYRKV